MNQNIQLCIKLDRFVCTFVQKQFKYSSTILPLSQQIYMYNTCQFKISCTHSWNKFKGPTIYTVTFRFILCTYSTCSVNKFWNLMRVDRWNTIAIGELWKKSCNRKLKFLNVEMIKSMLRCNRLTTSPSLQCSWIYLGLQIKWDTRILINLHLVN